MTPMQSETTLPRPRFPDAAAQPVCVETLGGFSVRIRGAKLQFGRKLPIRALNLLKYLSAQAGQELPASLVAATLWPASKRRPALGSLAVTLHRLRRLLGYPNAVVHRDACVALDPSSVWCDALEFERLLDQSARTERETERLHLTAQALPLYRGEFLAGERAPAWAVAIRERLRNRFVLGCAGQGERLAAALRWEEARTCFQRGLEADENAEELCLGLMTCQAALHQPLAAVAVYRRFALALAKRSGARPAMSLRRLYQRLLRQGAEPGMAHAIAARAGESVSDS